MAEPRQGRKRVRGEGLLRESGGQVEGSWGRIPEGGRVSSGCGRLGARGSLGSGREAGDPRARGAEGPGGAQGTSRGAQEVAGSLRRREILQTAPQRGPEEALGLTVFL